MCGKGKLCVCGGVFKSSYIISACTESIGASYKTFHILGVLGNLMLVVILCTCTSIKTELYNENRNCTLYRNYTIIKLIKQTPPIMV